MSVLLSDKCLGVADEFTGEGIEGMAEHISSHLKTRVRLRTVKEKVVRSA